MTFKELVKQKNIKQNFIAKQLKISPQLVSRWIKGDCEPQLCMVEPLAEILKVDIQSIINCFRKTK